MIPSSLRALLTGVIDYAGLFPPARLPLAEAVRNYLRYRQEPQAWMLGRFICPAARLGELAEFATEIGQTPLVVSALGRGGDSVSAFEAGLQADLADIATCRQAQVGKVVVDVLEVRLPDDAQRDREVCDQLHWNTADFAKRNGLSLFLEAEVDSGLTHLLERRGAGGFKLRTGGLRAAAFPSCEQVAQALAGCASADAPFKATAGLHHPFPRMDPDIGARMHGFVNVFVAGAMAHAHKLNAGQLVAILEDDEPAHFQFADPKLRWFDLELTTEAITEARRQMMTSFGSCSFDEPREDLRELELM